jgi:hypothetical protein
MFFRIHRIIRAIIFRLRFFGFSIEESCVAQYIYTMNRVSKMVPPKREILKDISLSFFPGAKIGVLG